jgi:hypothetical protein
MTEKLEKRKVKNSACLCGLRVSAVLFSFLGCGLRLRRDFVVREQYL